MMRIFVTLLLSCSLLSGCNNTSKEDFAIQYAKVKKECERIEIANTIVYHCKNSEDTLTIDTYPGGATFLPAIAVKWGNGKYEFHTSIPYSQNW